MFFLYNILIYLFLILIKIVGLFNEKAHLWLRGRKNIFFRLSEQIGKNKDLIWFHAASLGEFEQGRPVIEAFRKKFPHYKILLTFFSPSGYEIKKDYAVADYIFYLPIDTKSNARKFIKIVNPSMAVFIKYEFWFNYLNELKINGIPTFFVSVIFRKEQHFFKWYGGWFRKRLKGTKWIFVQNDDSRKLLESSGIRNASVSGDTRFDRVFEVAQQSKKFPLIEKFVSDSVVLLAGSTWQPDEELIKSLINEYNSQLKLIIAPHEIHKERIKSIVARLSKHKVLKYSQADENNIQNANVLIIDGIGFLSSLYQYCDIAYIGGGFGKGIHNILEAVTFGKPVIFGPNYQKFAEARDLVGLGGAFHISNKNELFRIAEKLLNNKVVYQTSSKICENYVIDKKGATDIIIGKISGFISSRKRV